MSTAPTHRRPSLVTGGPRFTDLIEHVAPWRITPTEETRRAQLTVTDRAADAEQARLWLDMLGLLPPDVTRPDHRGPSAADVAADRARLDDRIAALLADGRTHVQVAERLGIDVRRVVIHARRRRGEVR